MAAPSLAHSHSPPADARVPVAVVASLAAVYLIWGSTYLALRYVVEGLPPLLSGGGRYLAAGAVLYLGLRARGAPRPSARAWACALPVGALMFLVGNGFVAIAEREVASGLAAIVCATMPLFVAAIGAAGGERTGPREWAGMLLGIGGVAVMSAGDLRGAPGSALLLVVAPLGWAIGSVAARRLPLAPGLMSAATQMIAGGAATGLAGALRGERLPEHAPLRAWLSLAYLAVFGSIVAFSAYTYLLRRTRPSIATSYAYVNPVLAVLAGIAFAGEHPGPGTLAGSALVVVGVGLVVSARSR